VSIKKLSELTGRHRQTIAKILADLPLVNGQKGAHPYDSREALPLIYAVDNLEAARAEPVLSAVRRAAKEQARGLSIAVDRSIRLGS